MLRVLIALQRRDLADLLLPLLAGHGTEVIYDSLPLGLITAKPYDLLVMEGREDLVREIKRSDPRIEIILLCEGEMDEVRALGLGASACFPVPPDPDMLKSAIEDLEGLFALKRETAELERSLYSKYLHCGVVGKNPLMLDLISFVRRIAPFYRMVTITGETGTGKEVVAKALRAFSGKEDPFVTCNCGGLVEHLIESELFGHVKGAFTGAVADRKGLFESAGDGTILLDEIGELPLSFQPHLLRVLQDGDFRPVGSPRSLKARCRIIATTNRDLMKEVREGHFREDLYYRLTPLTIHVPPLRERMDDIPYLCRFFLEKFSEKSGKKIAGISTPAQSALMRYHWPGNVRELQNVIEGASVLSVKSFIGLEDLPQAFREMRGFREHAPRSLDEAIRSHISEVLRGANGNRTRAAKILGLTRRSLLRRMEKYTLS